MDPKASAKSKRAHTQHGRASHPSPASIVQRKKQSKEKKLEQSAGGGDEEPKRTRWPALPSNWGRYDDEDEVVDGVGNPSATEVAPKSKGADFGYLLEQARSQQQERDKLAGRGLPLPSSSEEFPLGNDILLSFLVFHALGIRFATFPFNYLSNLEFGKTYLRVCLLISVYRHSPYLLKLMK